MEGVPQHPFCSKDWITVSCVISANRFGGVLDASDFRVDTCKRVIHELLVDL
jgi:hypothetical protein